MPQQLQTKKVHIEILRIIAAFFVIVNHTNSIIFLNSQPSPLWFTSLAYFFASKTAVPVFVMIMGAVLIDKQDNLSKYIARISRIAVVTAFFSVVAYAFNGGGLSAKNVIKQILNSSNEPYWYLYLYLGLLLILPFMQKLAQVLSKKDIQILILVTLVAGGILPMLKAVGLTVHTSFYDGILSPYIGMVFAGYYIEKYANITKKSAVWAAAGFVAMIAVQTALTFKTYNSKGGADYLWLDNVKFVTVTFTAVCLYVVVKYILGQAKIGVKATKVMCYIGSLTFGIYLMGDFFKVVFAPLYTALSGYLPAMAAVVIYEIAIFAAAAVVTAVLKFIPIVKKLI